MAAAAVVVGTPGPYPGVSTGPGQSLPSPQMPYPVGRGDGLPRLLAKVGLPHGRQGAGRAALGL